jgi:hypothetical protein
VVQVSVKAEVPEAPRLALRKQEAARALGLSDESFDRYCVPTVRCVRVGSLRLYPVAELEKWLTERAQLPIEGR